jgi:hypothetical protein
MRESSTYQAIVEEGRAEGRAEGQAAEARRIVVRLGSQKLGAPDPTVVTALEGVDDIDVLENLITSILTVSSWSDLLARAPDR